MARKFALLFLIFALACKRKPAIPPDVIVRVNERMVTVTDFKRYLDRNAGTDLAQLTPEVASAMLDQYVEEIILSEHAAAHGVEVPAEKIAEAVRNEAGATVIEKRDDMRREQLLANISAEIPDPSPADLQSYYEQHLNDFKSGEEMRVRQILVHDEALANEIVKRLKQGEKFEDLSVEHSRAPNGKRGGEIGFVSRGELPKMFEEEIFRLRPGEISTPIQTDSSFHIFRVDERRAPGLLDAESAAPLIRLRLKEEALRSRMAQLVSRSRADMRIDVLTRRLPFRYTGTLRKTTDE